MTPPGVTDWSRTKNRDGSWSRRGPEKDELRRDPSFAGRTCAGQAFGPTRALEVIQIPHRLPK